MTIYVGHSNSFDFEKKLYSPLGTIKRHDFIFPHEHGKKELFDSRELFRSKKCDLMLAEVSYPSTGLGIELGWASNANIPIICIHKTKSKISTSLKTVTDEFIEYANGEDLINKISLTLNEHSKN